MKTVKKNNFKTHKNANEKGLTSEYG